MSMFDEIAGLSHTDDLIRSWFLEDPKAGTREVRRNGETGCEIWATRAGDGAMPCKVRMRLEGLPWTDVLSTRIDPGLRGNLTEAPCE
jgi:hypothetical protein